MGTGNTSSFTESQVIGIINSVYNMTPISIKGNEYDLWVYGGTGGAHRYAHTSMLTEEFRRENRLRP